MEKGSSGSFLYSEKQRSFSESSNVLGVGWSSDRGNIIFILLESLVYILFRAKQVMFFSLAPFSVKHLSCNFEIIIPTII